MDHRIEDAKLSDRERTVLLLAADGLTDKEIAHSLGLSLKTIHTYWDRMRQKLAANTRTQVFAKFLRLNVDATSPDSSDYKKLFATWEEGVWIFSVDGKTVYANQRVCETLGFASDELEEKHVESVLRDVGANEIVFLLEAMQREGQSCETSIKLRNGSKHWISLKATPMLDPQGRCRAIVALVHDITLQKRVEHALTTCSAVLSDLSDVSSDCIAKFDGELRCTYVNPSFLQVASVDLDAIVGRKISELGKIFKPNDLWLKHLQETLSSGKPQRMEAGLLGEHKCTATWFVPGPSAEFDPSELISVTKPT